MYAQNLELNINNKIMGFILISSPHFIKGKDDLNTHPRNTDFVIDLLWDKFIWNSHPLWHLCNIFHRVYGFQGVLEKSMV